MGRVNALYSNYTEIAVNNYYYAKSILKEIKRHRELDFCESNFMKAEHAIMITCVFSIMAIESFFNDYAATQLGDKEFYGNYDMLSLISKFQLIAKFILKADIEKDKAYYSNLKRAEKIRNELVHNKSKDFFDWKEKDNEKPDFKSEEELYQDAAIIRVNIKTLAKDLDEAKHSIAAIRDIALFFDEADKSCYALTDLFSSFLTYVYKDEPISKELKKEFNI